MHDHHDRPGNRLEIEHPASAAYPDRPERPTAILSPADVAALAAGDTLPLEKFNLNLRVERSRPVDPLFKDGKLTPAGKAMVAEDAARRRQEHGWRP
jgi:hypothetical protein